VEHDHFKHQDASLHTREISCQAPEAQLLSTHRVLTTCLLQDTLARGIGALRQEAFGAAMGLLVRRAPELHPGSCDMIVDMDRLDALTLRQLQVGYGLAYAVFAGASCAAIPADDSARHGGHLTVCLALLLLLLKCDDENMSRGLVQFVLVHVVLLAQAAVGITQVCEHCLQHFVATAREAGQLEDAPILDGGGDFGGGGSQGGEPSNGGGGDEPTAARPLIWPGLLAGSGERRSLHGSWRHLVVTVEWVSSGSLAFSLRPCVLSTAHRVWKCWRWGYTLDVPVKHSGAHRLQGCVGTGCRPASWRLPRSRRPATLCSRRPQSQPRQELPSWPQHSRQTQ
jgi:hypothetical protein